MTTPHIPHPWISERAKRGPHLTGHEHPTGFNGRLAVFISQRFGSMWAFYLLVVWMAGWVVLASAGIGLFAHDPYPFVFLLFCSNIIQLLSLPILAVGQRVLGAAADKQAQQTYKDAEAILKLQDEIYRLAKVNNELLEELRHNRAH